MVLDRHGRLEDRWSRDTADASAPRLVAWEHWHHEQDQPVVGPLGVEVPNSLPFAALRDVLDQVALVAIRFASFSDGRGLSLARQIRRHGFAGRIRLVGPLIPDQFAYALQCGVDEIELPDGSANRQSEDQWLKALSAYRLTYQRGYAAEATILSRRREARLRPSTAQTGVSDA